MAAEDLNPMEATDPQATPGKKRCGAKLRKKPGKRCQSDKLMPNGRCRLHGGKTPSGLASPNWKHGLKSKHRWQGSLPSEHSAGGSLADRFEAAMDDPSLASLRQALAVNDALLTSYLANLKTKDGRPVTPTQENRILKLLHTQGVLAEKEARRLRDLHTMVGREQFLMMVNLCTALFVRFVPDMQDRAEIQRQLQQAMLAAGQRLVPEGGD